MQRWLTLCGLIMAYGSLWATGAIAQRVVVVKENDTVWSLAKRYHVLPQDIVKANGLKNPDSLKPGTRLRIPSAVKPAIAPVTMRKTAVINGDRVCVRYAPNRTDRFVTLLDKGQPVLVTARKGSWLQVKTPAGQMGWVRDDLVKVTGTLVMKPSAHEKQKTAKRPAVQSAHKSKNTRVARAHRSTSPRNANRSTSSGTSAGESIVRIASRFKGVRYRWGGSSRSGFDCSGFTRYVFRQRTGVELPHSASAQFRKGTPVSRGELKPGDLVFFQTYRRGASHVGIYIGNGKFIHASSAGGRVRVDSLNDGYYRQRYVGARRITR
ncbi:MAG: C40 family peptidase [Armatimonadota bacterium]